MEFQQSSQATETSVAENLNLRHYWHILLERRWLVITTFISVVILSVLYLYRAVPIYQAKTVLQINKESTSIMDVGSQVVFNSNDQEYLQTQYKNLLSRSLIESVIADLELKQDEVFKGAENIVNAVRACITTVETCGISQLGALDVVFFAALAAVDDVHASLTVHIHYT